MEDFTAIEEVREAADRYEDWQHTSNECNECQDYVHCPSCSVLFEYEIAMAIVMATLFGFEWCQSRTMLDINRIADVMVDANWTIRYGEKWGATLDEVPFEWLP